MLDHTVQFKPSAAQWAWRGHLEVVEINVLQWFHSPSLLLSRASAMRLISPIKTKRSHASPITWIDRSTIMTNSISLLLLRAAVPAIDGFLLRKERRAWTCGTKKVGTVDIATPQSSSCPFWFLSAERTRLQLTYHRCPPRSCGVRYTIFFSSWPLTDRWAGIHASASYYATQNKSHRYQPQVRRNYKRDNSPAVISTTRLFYFGSWTSPILRSSYARKPTTPMWYSDKSTLYGGRNGSARISIIGPSRYRCRCITSTRSPLFSITTS